MPPLPGERPAEYRLNVFATGADEVVCGIGGWLCDLSLAGWAVTVTFRDACDDRPLRILGARVATDCSLRSALPHIVANTHGAMAISSALLDGASADGHSVDAALRSSRHSCVWGQPSQVPDTLELRFTRYQPSAAALAFKAQAVLAAGLGGSPIGTTEKLMRSYCIGAPSTLR
jgi:hypothetical protein